MNVNLSSPRTTLEISRFLARELKLPPHAIRAAQALALTTGVDRSPSAPVFEGAQAGADLPAKIHGRFLRQQVLVASDFHGTFYADPEMDRKLLQAGTMPLAAGPTFRLAGHFATQEARQAAAATLFKMAQGKLLFDGAKVRQSGFASDHAIQLAPTRYFSSVVSNEICHRRWSRTDFAPLLSPFRREGSGWQFDPARHGALSNHVGVTTLAITRDGHALIFRGKARNQQGGGRYQAAGSGSMDWSDLAHANGDFRQALTYAMGRELCEELIWDEAETGLQRNPARLAELTTVVGSFLWAERGCKPEYSGITALPLLARQVRAHGAEMDDEMPGRFVFSDRSLSAASTFAGCLPGKAYFSLGTAVLLHRLTELAKSARQDGHHDHTLAAVLMQ